MENGLDPIEITGNALDVLKTIFNAHSDAHAWPPITHLLVEKGPEGVKFKMNNGTWSPGFSSG